MNPEEITETSTYRDIQSRYNGLCETAEKMQAKIVRLEAAAMTNKAQKEIDKSQKIQQDMIMQGQVNGLNSNIQDLGAEVNRLRALVQELGGDPDEHEGR